MAKENTVLTIDVGGDNLKMAEFVFPPGGAIMLRKFAFRKLEEQEGMTPEEVFARNYREMLAEGGFVAKSVRLSLSGQSSFSRLSKLPPLMGNKSAINKIVEYEARQTVPYPMNEVVWDYQLIRHEWEDTRVETQEDGSTLEIADSHEEYEALFVAVKTDQITCYTDVIEDSGKEILSVEIAPVALFNAAKGTQCRDDECVLILNIGGRGTNLMIADHQRAFIRSIPIAGDAITQQVAKEYNIGFAEAEDLKHRHGFVALGGAYEEPESEVAATISKIARNVMTRLHGEVSRSINVWRAQHGGNAPSRVLLAGGGSTMMYITDFFQEKLRLPVEYLNTFGAITIAEQVDKEELQAVAPMFQELIGMSLRSITQCPFDISLVPASIRNQKELDRKKPYFYISAASLLVCLGIFYIGVYKRLNFDKSRVDRVQVRVEETNKKMKEVTNLMNQMNSAKSRYENAKAFVDARGKWTGMLTELQELIPDTMWLTTLEGIGDEIAPAAGSESDRPGMGMDMGGGPFGGGPFGGGPFGGGGRRSSANPAEPVARVYRDIGEVKQLRLVGYTLVLKNRDLLERELRNRFKTSKYFSDAEDGTVLDKYEPNTEALNMTSFEMRVTLKEPIKK